MEHLDVVIVGAGLSGIGMAWHLQDRCPSKTYAILEAREASGGTWDLFRYPGVRSDSDMQTLGYRFKPWTGSKALADGPSILSYVRETAAEAGIDAHIRYGHKVVRAEWSTPDARWTVHAEGREPVSCASCSCAAATTATTRASRRRSRAARTSAARSCTRSSGPTTSTSPASASSSSAAARPRSRSSPRSRDPAPAHVTMLQRSPSYILSMPDEDAIANALRRRLGERRAYAITRWKNVALATLLFQLSQRFPRPMRKLYRAGALRQLPAGYAVDTHFNPRYKPWDQRLCLVPNGDLFETISDGSAEIVTAEIERFTRARHPPARRLRARGRRDRHRHRPEPARCSAAWSWRSTASAVDLPRTMAYKSMMLSGLPNLVFTIGYTNASWTLKADLVAEYACRLINHMDANGHRRAVPVRDPSVGERPFLDFSPGYVLRSIDQLPRQGAEAPWRLSMSYILDVAKIRHGRVDDGVLEFA